MMGLVPLDPRFVRIAPLPGRPLALNAHYYRHRVELELTPTWWRRLSMSLTSRPEHAPSRELLAQAIAIALELPAAHSVRVELTSFVVMVAAPHDCTIELLARAAEVCREKLHALDIGCLANVLARSNVGEPH